MTFPGSEPAWQEGAGSLLLAAAAQETGFLAQMEAALAPCVNASLPRSGCSRRSLLLTLLFLNAVGLRRTRDLRSYTGAALALLTGRKRAYGYFHTERFLTSLANNEAGERLQTVLGAWTATLWQSGADPCCLYIDGHRKAVYSDKLIPRGLIGNSGKVLGARALVLLHDKHGHPLFSTTSRGDQHLTVGAPALLARYQACGGRIEQARLVVDREGMAAQFLRDLAQAGYTVITILRTDQYAGIDSFTNVGSFVPLAYDRCGQVAREVAPACFALPLPDCPGQVLPLTVALIRDLRCQVSVEETEEEAEERSAHKRAWWRDGWKAEPTPASPTTAKLVPIVTTAKAADPVELVQTYTRRWPAQENIIRDFLLPLGLDTNHGYGKRPVENSEVSKKRAALEKRLSNIQKWAVSAEGRAHRTSKLYSRLWKDTKHYGEQLYRMLNQRLGELEEQGMHSHQLRQMKRELVDRAEAELAPLWQRVYRTLDTSNKEHHKCERYAHEQCDVLRALEELSQHERGMYELNNRKDQIMSVFKLALANLVMWTRDRYFPATYEHATWKRLAPFFQLAGRVISSPTVVAVELRPFNDRQLNRDLLLLCQRVNQAQAHLPDGRLLVIRLISWRIAASKQWHL